MRQSLPMQELRDRLAHDISYQQLVQYYAPGLESDERKRLRLIMVEATSPFASSSSPGYSNIAGVGLVEILVALLINCLFLRVETSQHRLSGLRAALLLATHGDIEGCNLLLGWLTKLPRDFSAHRVAMERTLTEAMLALPCANKTPPHVLPVALLEPFFLAYLTPRYPFDLSDSQTDLLIAALHYSRSAQQASHINLCRRIADLSPAGRNRHLIVQTAQSLIQKS